MIAYIATPYTHPDPGVRERRYELACQATRVLQERYKDFAFYSPIAMWHPIAKRFDMPSTADYWESVNNTFLLSCRNLTVVKFAGWKTSAGVLAEIAFAKENACTVVYFEPEDLGIPRS